MCIQLRKGYTRVIKKLRNKHHFSQEQLATMSGLSLRTIQRVESGKSASLETLKSLAAVFEVEIEFLTGEITVIDKKTEEWACAPLWVRLGYWSISERKVAIRWEMAALITGTLGFIGGILLDPAYFRGTILFGAAYYYAVMIRWVDNEGLWQ